MSGTMISGYCPMGCGQTLSVMAKGHVTCRKLECPRPDAVSEILADAETEHVVKFGETTFTVRHPLRERLDGQLMDCQVHEWVAALDGPPVPPGTYRAAPPNDAGGVWSWTEIDPGADVPVDPTWW